MISVWSSDWLLIRFAAVSTCTETSNETTLARARGSAFIFHIPSFWSSFSAPHTQHRSLRWLWISLSNAQQPGSGAFTNMDTSSRATLAARLPRAFKKGPTYPMVCALTSSQRLLAAPGFKPSGETSVWTLAAFTRWFDFLSTRLPVRQVAPPKNPRVQQKWSAAGASFSAGTPRFAASQVGLSSAFLPRSSRSCSLLSQQPSVLAFFCPNSLLSQLGSFIIWLQKFQVELSSRYHICPPEGAASPEHFSLNWKRFN